MEMDVKTMSQACDGELNSGDHLGESGCAYDREEQVRAPPLTVVGVSLKF